MDSSINFHDEESDQEVQEFRVRERLKEKNAPKLGEVATKEEIAEFFEAGYVEHEEAS